MLHYLLIILYLGLVTVSASFLRGTPAGAKDWVYGRQETTLEPQSVSTAWVGQDPRAGSGEQGSPGRNLILAHYMTWFKTREYSGYWQHWNWDPDGDGKPDVGDRFPDNKRADGRLDLATAYYPLIGSYDSSDPFVIEYQVATAWAAGIDGFVADWYGPQDREGIDQALEQVFALVSKWRAVYGLQFYIAIAYEEQILRDVPAAVREEMAFEHLKYLLNQYASQSGYLTYEGVPVIFYFEAWENGVPGLLRPAQLMRLKRSLPPFYLLYMGAYQDFLGASDGFYSWVSGANEDPYDWGADYVNWIYPEMDFRAREHGLKVNVGSVWAGFDDSKVWGWGTAPRLIDRQDGAVYRQTWEAALKAQAQQTAGMPNWVQIITWNDWNEGSQIEPSIEYGRFYLEETQRFAAQYTRRQLPANALLIPDWIYWARRRRPGPETEAVVQEVYPLFFNEQFDAALARLEAAGWAREDGP